MKEIYFQEQKLIALEILKFVHRFCRDNNLRMFLSYGTLLGAIRHKGFIPWDDDVDIMMPRKDYEILLKSFPEHPRYKLQCIKNDPKYTKAFATINDIRTFKEEYTIRNKFNKNLCINIDIFPFDTFPDDNQELRKFKNQIELRLKILQCLSWKYSKGKTFTSTILKNMGILGIRTLEFFNILSLKKYLTNFDKFITQYNNTKSKNCGCSEDITVIPSAIFDTQIEVDFENYKFPAPQQYDLFLKSIYGDYMKLPPESERIPHHLCKCYWRTNK